MKVKNLSVDKVREGMFLVAKAKGTYDNGSMFADVKKVGDQFLQLRKMKRSAFDFIYELKDTIEVVVHKPSKTDKWPGWSPAMDKFDGHKMQIKAGDIELFDEDGIKEHYLMLDDETGINLAWVEPTSVPEFKDEQYKHLFKPVEIALPKKPLGLSEIKLLADDSIQEAFAAIKEGASGTANWCVVKGGDVKNRFGQACHYDLRHAGKCDYIVTDFGKVKTGASVWWGYYLANLSPLKDCFLLKDIDAIVDGGYVLDVSQPANAIGMACIATRQAWEYEDRVNAFYALCKRGVPVDLAFLAAQKAVYSGGALKWTRDHSGHGVIPVGTIGDKGCISFINHKMTEPNKPFVENNNYNGTDILFRAGGNRAFEEGLEQIGGEMVRGMVKPLPIEQSLDACVEFLQEWADANF